MKLLNIASLTTLIVGLVAGALVKIGIEEQTAGAIGQAVAAAIAAGVTAYLTHRATLNATPPDKSKGEFGGGGYGLSLLLTGVVLAGITFGCVAATPAQRLADAERGITLLANAITAADQRGLIKDADKADLIASLEALRLAANSAHNVYAAAATRPSLSGSDLARLTVDEINARLAELNQRFAAAQAGK